MPPSQSTPTDPSSLLEISSASAAAVPGVRESSCTSGGTDSSSALAERERSPPVSRRALARTPRKTVSPYPTGPSSPVPTVNQTMNQLNIGASPQEVLDAQRFAAEAAANSVAAQAEVLHQASMNEVQSQVRDVIAEAGSTVEQLREQLRSSEVRCNELFEYGQFVEHQLVEAKAELSRVEAELLAMRTSYQELAASLQECQSANNSVNFQLNQTRVENQVKDREIQRLRQAAHSASSSASPPKIPKSGAPSVVPVSETTETSWFHIGSSEPLPQSQPFAKPFMTQPPPASHPPSSFADPRVDQLIDVVQQLVQQVSQNATDPQETAREDEDDVGCKETREKDVVDQRALLHLKLEPIPPDAASFRSWRNAFKVQLSKLDISGKGVVLAWVNRAFDSDRADLEDSELLPRLDSWLAGELSSNRVTKQVSEIEQDIAAYIESCGQLAYAPKGRVMIHYIARHFDLDRVRGSVLTASTLFQVEIGGNSIKDLRDFVNRIRLVLNAIPIGQRPDDRLTGEWLFHKVKGIRKLERVIEDIRESGATSYRREWPYLWDKIQDLLVHDREDTNALSVLKSLQAATPHAKPKGMPALDGNGDKGKTKAPPAAPPKSTPPKADPPPPPIAPGAPAPNAKPKGKAKAKAKALTDAEKAKTPCIFFQMPSGCIHGDNCKFSHKAAPTKPKTKAKETPKGKPGAVAKAVVALVAASSLCTPAVSAGPTFAIEWAADTAAGRHLGSAKALCDQGVPHSAFSEFLGASKSPVTFHTGGGPQPGVKTLGFQSDNMDFANHYMLDSCPLVRSTGIDVDSGRAFIWLPGSLPFFVSDTSQLRIQCPEHLRHYATRVDEHVPIFTSRVKFVHGASGEVSQVSGGLVQEEEEPIGVPSVPKPLDSHPAEARARQLLKSSGKISSKAVKNLFELVDKEPAPRGDTGDSFSTGFFRLGGVLGLRTATHQFPSVTQALNQFARERVPGFGYTTLSIFRNVLTSCHKDFHNAHLDNVVISLGGFSGGGVWVQDPSGSVPCPSDSSLLGKVLTFRNGVVRFRAKDTNHATMPWRGDRVVMVLFSTKHPNAISDEHCRELRESGFPIDLCEDPLPAVPAEAPEGLAADAPPAIAEIGGHSDLGIEGLLEGDSEERVPERIIRMRDEAMSLKHRLFHFPKNAFCDICNRARMLARRVRRKPRPDDEDDPFEASEFGEVIAADHIHVFRSPDDSTALDKSYVVLCLRDKFTGFFGAFPGNDRSTGSIVVAIRKFIGRRTCSKPVTLVSDAADEFEAAAAELGWIWSSSIPNRFPHNSQLEREIRTFQEGVRSSFLEAGFSVRPELWTVACCYGSTAMNLTLPAPEDSERSRWDFMTSDAGREDASPRRLLLGQLVFYRHKGDNKFGPNAAPGLFAGWRLEAGGIYRSVVLVLDLGKLHHRTGAWAEPLNVPESELYVRSGDPVFPLRNAAERALQLCGDDDFQIPNPLPLPFSSEDVIKKKSRRVYITYSRFLKLGPTPGCSACDNDKSNHSPECIARFEAAFGKEVPPVEDKSPEEFLSYEELGVPRPEARPEGDHLSDYEPSEPDAERVPAIVAKHRHQLKGANVLFQITSHSHSRLIDVGATSGIRIIQVSCDQVDFCDPSVLDQLVLQVSAFPGCCLLGSLPGDGWQRKANGFELWKTQKYLLGFLQVAAVVMSNGGEVAIEFPRDSTCWMYTEMQAFQDQFNLKSVCFEGCAFGITSLSGCPLKAPWRMLTTNRRLTQNLSVFECPHDQGTKHEGAHSLWPRISFYPDMFFRTVLVSLYPFAGEFNLPALPCVPSFPQVHREKDAKPSIPIDVLMHESGVQEAKVPGLVHRLLDRKEWAGQPGAYEAIKKEKDGSVDVGTWIENEIVSKRDILDWATRTSNVVHFGNLMVILSVKGSELSPDQWRLKARIVFRGDDIRDQSGMSAVFEELFASSPSSLEGLNTAVAFGLLESSGVTTSDAVRAYTQALLKTKHKTYVLLPPELVPDDKKHIHQPCAPLHKALYGHPESSAYWQQHLHAILVKLGGVEFRNLPSVYHFPALGLVLCVYVDDLTLAGKMSLHEGFWSTLSKQVELEPFAPLTRVLGRSHRFVFWQEKRALALETADFAKQCVQLYESVADRTVKPQCTPHLDVSTLPVADDDSRGQLSDSAARILMKVLWLARLSRPDLLVAVTTLASHVCCWSVNDDRRVARMIGYIARSADYSIIMSIHDPPSELRLALYCDSDFAGCIDTSRSTSGYVLALEGPASFALLSWSSRRQKVVSRSSTEAEFVSLSGALFNDAVPMLEVWEALIPDIHLHIFEDNQACIAIVRKGFSAKLRHLAKTHRVNVASTCELVNTNDNIGLSYVETGLQRGDPLTKALAVQKWAHALELLSITTSSLPSFD